MNKLVKGLLVGFIALQMVGCEEAKEVENIAIQDTKPVVEEIENEYCDDCGNRLDYCECNEEPQVEEVAPVEDEVVFNCINCGEAHLESQSYYNEDGMSACCEECYNDYVNGAFEEVEDFEVVTPEYKYGRRECKNCYRDFYEGYYDDACSERCHLRIEENRQKMNEHTQKVHEQYERLYEALPEEEKAERQAQKAERERIQEGLANGTICPDCYSENIEELPDTPYVGGTYIHCLDCGFRN